MTGTCRYCGQTKIIKAEDQEHADALVTIDCNCEGGAFERQKKEVRDTLAALIGEQAPEYGWEATTPHIYECIANMADLVVAGDIASIGLRIAETNLKITRTKGKINVERTKTIKQGGQIEK